MADRTQQQVINNSPRVKLELSQDQYEDIVSDVDKVRSTSKTVTVQKDPLMALMYDYSQLLNFYEKVNGL